MKKQMKILMILLLLSELFVTVVFSQEKDNTKLPSIIPPSPDASSIGKFGEVPVSKYTGIPQISIPIYTISEGDIKIDVSLNYHAGGIRVEEHSGWTGLGWALNAGGIITRSVVGLPDEKLEGYLNQPYDVNNIPNLSQATIQTIIRGVNNRTLDIEPDIFSFNLPGASGKIIYDNTTQSWISSPKQDVKITNTIVNNVITEWEIIDGKGFTYKFQVKEKSIVESFDGADRSNSFNQTFNSAWYLTEISSPTGNAITFNYQAYTNNYYTRQGVTKYIFLGGGYNDGNYAATCSAFSNEIERYLENTIQGYRIESIQFSNGKIKFVKSNATRLDMPNDYCLDAIELRDLQNNLVRKYQLVYSYYESNAGSVGNASVLYNQNFKKRLKLDKVQEVSNSQIASEYSLQYINGELPSIFSNSQDHWGFYNGANNVNLVPLDGVNGFGGGTTNRAVDFNFAKIGTLEKITYPTGGHTFFTYESNDASISEAQYFEYFYPYGPTSIQYLQSYSGSVWHTNKTSNIYVDLKTVNLDLSGNNFSYTVYLNHQGNCNGSDKDCIGNLEVLLICTDCGSTGGAGTIFSLTSGNFVNGTSTGVIKLIPGRNYTLQMSGPSSATQGASASITGSKEVLPVAGNSKMNVQVGGLRVKNIKLYTQTNSLPMVTDYIYNDNINYEPSITPIPESSGSLVSFPVYDQLGSYNIRSQVSQNFALYYNCFYRIMSSISKMPLAGTGGSIVGYSHVQTFKTDGIQKIRSLASFASPKEYPDVMSYSYPPVIELSYENMRGDLIKEKNFSLINNQYTLVTLSENTYERPAQFVTHSAGLKIGITKFIQATLGDNEYVLKPYHLSSEWKYLNSTASVSYDQNGGNAITSITNLSYDNPQHFQLTKSVETSSTGKIITNNFIYPQDYQSGNSIIEQLIAKHITSIPLETVKYQEVNGIRSVIGGTAITMKSGGAGLIDIVYRFESNQPISQSGFKFSNKLIGILPFANGSGTTQIPDSRYAIALKYDLYDNKGNILQVTGRDGLIRSYLWGYNQQYPVAEVIGKNYNDVVSQSGINLTVLNNPSNEAALQIELTKVRSLSGVLAKTYTYKPLIGISSETDVSGRTNYYEYDAMNRLYLIRNQEGHILKKFCYNYNGQNTDCITQFGNQQLSQTFTRNNCGSGYAGSQVIYSVPANTYFAGTQAAANTLAQNDINANGQAYANANGTCTLVCTNCTADSRKCINGICERGLKICVNSYFDYSMWMFVNTYYYQWSDGSTSQLYVEYNFCNCDGSQCM